MKVITNSGKVIKNILLILFEPMYIRVVQRVYHKQTELDETIKVSSYEDTKTLREYQIDNKDVDELHK